MPVCTSCFAYYVRAPCPYCADTGSPAPGTSVGVRTSSAATGGLRAPAEKPLRRQVEDLQGKNELLQKETLKLKEELTEKNRIIARLEAELRSSNEDKNFLLTKISELEGK